MIRQDPFKKGEPLTAKDLEAIRLEAKRMESFRVAAPLQLSRSAAGVLLTLSGSLGGGSTATIYKTTAVDSSYPTLSEHTGIFPATVSSVSFDDDIEDVPAYADSEPSEANTKYILNLSGLWIPQSTRVVCWEIGGEILTYFQPACEIVRGYLDEELDSSSGLDTATMSVWEYNSTDGWHNTGNNVLVGTRGSFPASGGVYCTAIGPITEAVAGTFYEVQSLGCV